MPKLTIEQISGPDSLTVTLAGSLSRSNSKDLDEVFSAILASPGREPVVLNLYECEYIDEPSVRRLGLFLRQLRERLRDHRLYVRPMSFVSYRVKSLSPSPEVPESISQEGERNLAERRLTRLRKWRKERPVRDLHPPGVVGAPGPPPVAEAGGPAAAAGPQESDLVPIDFKRVSLLAEKDERVIQRIWETYCRLLDTGAFKEAPDGEAETQLSMDAQVVARKLRLNPKDVRRVIEAVSTHLMDLLESEETGQVPDEPSGP